MYADWWGVIKEMHPSKTSAMLYFVQPVAEAFYLATAGGRYYATAF